MLQHTRLKTFDLQVGDKIRSYDSTFGAILVFEVVHISDSVFTCQRVESTYKTAFQAKDYQLGFVQRVGEGKDEDLLRPYKFANSPRDAIISGGAGADL